MSSIVPPDKEPRISLNQAAKLLKNRQTPVSYLALWRWATCGRKAHSGRRIYLEHVMVGRRIFTTEASLDRFIERTTEEDFVGRKSRAKNRRAAAAAA